MFTYFYQRQKVTNVVRKNVKKLSAGQIIPDPLGLGRIGIGEGPDG